MLNFNRSEIINQSLNKQSISNVLNNARSTMNSWLTNLGTSIQTKAAIGPWNTFGTGNIFEIAAGKSAENQEKIYNKKKINRSSISKLKTEFEKESFIFYLDSEDENVEEETSV